jgi:hypothetical protein
LNQETTSYRSIGIGHDAIANDYVCDGVLYADADGERSGPVRARRAGRFERFKASCVMTSRALTFGIENADTSNV